MATKLDIVNRALISLGNNTITSLDNLEPTALTMLEVYTITKNAELAAYRWNFALQREQLPALTQKPAFDYEYAYQLPSDFLRLERVVSNGWRTNAAGHTPYVIEGDKILTDIEPPLQIRYLRKFEKDDLLPDLFIEVFALKLAIKACNKSAQDGQLLSMLYNEYNMALRTAKKANAIQLAPIELGEGEFIRSRF